MIETSQLCKFTMSDFEFFVHRFFFKYSNSFSVSYSDLVNLFCVISRAKDIRLGFCVQFGWVVKTFKFYEVVYDNSFVFGSAGSTQSLLPLGN